MSNLFNEYYTVWYWFELVGVQSKTNNQIEPISGTNAIKNHAPLLPISCNLLTNIDIDGMNIATQ